MKSPVIVFVLNKKPRWDNASFAKYGLVRTLQFVFPAAFIKLCFNCSEAGVIDDLFCAGGPVGLSSIVQRTFLTYLDFSCSSTNFLLLLIVELCLTNPTHIINFNLFNWTRRQRPKNKHTYCSFFCATLSRYANYLLMLYFCFLH